MKLNDTYFYNAEHLDIASARYFLKDEKGQLIEEDIDDVFVRVVNFLYQDDPEHKELALRLRREKKLLDAGRPLAQAGTKNKNLYNCLVLAFGDKDTDGDTREAISELKRKHFSMQAIGNGIGINFSTLRPCGSICKTTQSRSSGAVGFITDFSYQSSNIMQGGNRSGANLGLLEDTHPDLYEFTIKKSESNWENIRAFANIVNEDEFDSFQWKMHYPWQMFNVSVLLSDKFMQKLNKSPKSEWQLYWKDTPWFMWDFENTTKSGTKRITVCAVDENMAFYKASAEIPYFRKDGLNLLKGPYNKTVSDWYNLICENSWRDGCPGVLFIDTARQYHNGEYFGTIVGANACSEQPMPANSICCLSTLVLPSFFHDGKFDFDEFKVAIKEAIRGLDNIISLSKTGEKEIDEAALNERRVGLSTTGIAELLIREGLKYSSKEGRKYVARLMEFMRDKAYEASIDLAKERGAFPAYEYKGFSQSKFFETLPEYIQNLIKRHGIRNVTTLTAAPVGTTGTMLGFSTGIEPYFAMCYRRNSRVGSFIDGSPAFREWMKANEIDFEKYNNRMSELRENVDVPDYFEEAHEISWRDHLEMQAVFSKYVDSSVSKTINLPSDATVEDIKEIFNRAWELGIKSTTIYRDGSKKQILEKISQKSAESRPQSIIKASAPKRPQVLPCDIHHTSVKGEVWTVLVGLLDGKPFEVFCAPSDNFEISEKYERGKLIKGGNGMYCLDVEDFKIKNISNCLKTDEHRTITRMLSLSLRHGVGINYIIDQLSKADGNVVDFSKAILRVLRKYNTDEIVAVSGVKCTNCGSENIVSHNGCQECLNCGGSKCG